MLADPQIVAPARASTIENFRLVFNGPLIGSIVSHMDDSQDLFHQIHDGDTFRRVVMDHYLRRMFEGAWAAG